MKKLIALLLALCMALSLAACGTKKDDNKTDAPAESGGASSAEQNDAPEAASELTFTTGGEQGTYYDFGTVLAGQVSGITVVPSDGSKANIEAVDAGEAHLGFVQSDVMSYAYKGENLFTDAITGFSTVAALYTEQVQIVSCDPSIKTVKDLAGKNVSIGAPGSGVYFNAVDILNAYDVTLDDITPTFENFGESVEDLKEGKLDAAFIVAGAPTSAVTSLAADTDIYLVALDDRHINDLTEDSPYYTKSIISADTYGLEADTTTVAVGAVVIARNDCAEEDVYNFVSTIFENTDAITSAHAKGAELDVKYAASVTTVPYHAGAAKYFAEKDIAVPTK